MRLRQKNSIVISIEFSNTEKESIYLGLIIGVFFLLVINVLIGIILGLVTSTLYRVLRAEKSLNGHPYLIKPYRIKRNHAYCKLCRKVCSGITRQNEW